MKALILALWIKRGVIQYMIYSTYNEFVNYLSEVMIMAQNIIKYSAITVIAIIGVVFVLALIKAIFDLILTIIVIGIIAAIVFALLSGTGKRAVRSFIEGTTNGFQQKK
jgi:hypothetical protein